MKKLLLMNLIGIFNVFNQCHATNINGHTTSYDKPISVINGKVYGHIIENIIQGSGKAETKETPIAKIKNISVSGLGNLVIKQCEDPQNDIESLVMTADDNILPYLTYSIKDDKIEIGIKKNASFITKTPIQYHVTVRNINSISNSGLINVQASPISTDSLKIKMTGSGNVTMKNIITNRLHVEKLDSGDIKACIDTKTLYLYSRGSGDIILSGNTDIQTVNLGISENYDAKQLKSNTAHIDISCAAIAYLDVTTKIDGRLSGSSSVLYNKQHNPKVNVRASSGTTLPEKSSW